MNEKEIRWIDRMLRKQGFHIDRTPSGVYVIRDSLGRPAGLVGQDPDRHDWHRVLFKMKRNGWLDWPPRR